MHAHLVNSVAWENACGVLNKTKVEGVKGEQKRDGHGEREVHHGS